MTETNESAQEGELVVLASMYMDDFKQAGDGEREHEITITLNGFEHLPNPPKIKLLWFYSANYPSISPPIFRIEAVYLNGGEIKLLYGKLLQMYEEEKAVILFNWIEWLRENTTQFLGLQTRLDPNATKSNVAIIEEELELECQDDNTIFEKAEQENFSWKKANKKDGNQEIDIVSGESYTDRKSKFVAHLARVHSVKEVDLVLGKLKENKRIHEATHNITAYRIRSVDAKGNTIMIENRDDDGETGAGDKLMYMLRRLQVVNAVVIVTRWFGGILLGADRFKIIVAVAKELVLKEMGQELEGSKKVDKKSVEHKTEEKKPVKKEKPTKQKFDYLLILDYEATCDDSSNFGPREIIEWPTILVNTKTREVEDIFHQYVKPTECPNLTTFCTQLTGIQQEWVNSAKLLDEVSKDFIHWMNSKRLLDRPSKCAIVTCGDWDLSTQFPTECGRKGIEVPHFMKRWINIKFPFSYQYLDSAQKKALGMKGMLSRLRINLEGRHHCGLDDCKNITKIVVRLLEDGCEFTITGQLAENAHLL